MLVRGRKAVTLEDYRKSLGNLCNGVLHMCKMRRILSKPYAMIRNSEETTIRLALAEGLVDKLWAFLYDNKSLSMINYHRLRQRSKCSENETITMWRNNLCSHISADGFAYDKTFKGGKNWDQHFGKIESPMDEALKTAIKYIIEMCDDYGDNTQKDNFSEHLNLIFIMPV